MTGVDHAAEIGRARALLARHFAPTPLVRAASWSTGRRTVYFKNETVLPTGSFKVRGAVYALSARLASGAVREVVAASTGNHGAAVAFAGKLLGVPARIFLPRDANPVKVARIRDSGGTIVHDGVDLSDAIDAASGYATRTGAFFLHDAEARDIPVGTATIGAEILDEAPLVDVAYVPMGDTALIRGVASALKLSPRQIHIVGVVAEAAPAYYLSWTRGTVVETESADTIADGLAVRRPLQGNVLAIRQLVDEVVTVSENEMLDTIAELHASEGILAEPSGAAALAALLRDKTRQGCSVVLVTGGNIAPEVIRRLASAPKDS